MKVTRKTTGRATEMEGRFRDEMRLADIQRENIKTMIEARQFLDDCQGFAIQLSNLLRRRIA